MQHNTDKKLRSWHTEQKTGSVLYFMGTRGKLKGGRQKGSPIGLQGFTGDVLQQVRQWWSQRENCTGGLSFSRACVNWSLLSKWKHRRQQKVISKPTWVGHLWLNRGFLQGKALLWGLFGVGCVKVATLTCVQGRAQTLLCRVWQTLLSHVWLHLDEMLLWEIFWSWI